MIVVDTNIIGYLYLNSDHSAQVERVLLNDPLWAAPLLWRSEFRNVLAFYLRRKVLRLEEAQGIMEEAKRLMTSREFEVSSSQVLILVSASTCSAYDCEFVALAKDLEAPLVTVDRQILAQFPETAVSLERYLDEISA